MVKGDRDLYETLVRVFISVVSSVSVLPSMYCDMHFTKYKDSEEKLAKTRSSVCFPDHRIPHEIHCQVHKPSALSKHTPFFHSPIFGLNLIIELLNVLFPPLQQHIRQTANLSRMNTLRALTHSEELWVLPTVSNRTV